MKVIHGTRPEELEASIRQATSAQVGQTSQMRDTAGPNKPLAASGDLPYKACPVCGSICFSDMDTCYGCLHKFGSELPQNSHTIPAQAPYTQSVPAQTSVASSEPARVPFTPSVPAQTTFEPSETTQTSTAPNAPAQVPFRDVLRMEPQAQVVIAGNTQNKHEIPLSATADSNNNTVSRHVCTRENGDAFEITVTVRML